MAYRLPGASLASPATKTYGTDEYDMIKKQKKQLRHKKNIQKKNYVTFFIDVIRTSTKSSNWIGWSG